MNTETTYQAQGFDIALGILQRSTKYLIYYDPDIDGVISGELFRRLLVHLQVPYEVYINENRQHGFKMPRDLWENYKGYTIILVDAYIEEDVFKELIEYGINIINLDHHHRTEGSLLVHTSGENYGVVINNNYPFEPVEWNYLSGAGVVYYFIQYLLPTLQGVEEQSLVGISLLSDIRDLGEYTAKQFLHVLYHTNTPFLQYLIDISKPHYDFGFGQYTLDRNFVDYTFSPKINALFRANRGEMVMSIFSGVADEAVRDTLDVLRGMQQKMVEFIKIHLDFKELQYINYATIPYYIQNLWGLDMTNYIGITCSDFVNKGKTTIITVVDEEGNIIRGSLRGLCNDVPYLDLLCEQGADARGHQGAFGILQYTPTQESLSAFDQAVGQHEKGYETRKYKGTIKGVGNLKFVIQNGEVEQMAQYNNYVRDGERSYIRYTGDSSRVERIKHGKKIEFVFDGVTVLCFDDELTVENALILPIYERGKVVTLFMHRY